MKPININATQELISAISALNTEVTAEPLLHNHNEDIMYISQAEPLVAHSIEHIQSAINVLHSIRKDINSIQDCLFDIPFDKFDMTDDEDKIVNLIDSVISKL